MIEPRVLVVDDEEGPREAIRMILKPHYQVFTAGSGAEVLASLPGLHPDIIFMDVKMPRMDGVQLLERVKEADPQVEVVMITAYASLDTVQRAMRFGAMDYLVKPFAPKELEEAAERALSRRRQRLTGPAGTLAPLIGQMRDLARDSAPRTGEADLGRLLLSLTREAQRLMAARAASFIGTAPVVAVHSDLPDPLPPGAEAWHGGLAGSRAPVALRPGMTTPWPWPDALARATGATALLVIPVGDEGRPRVAGHLVLHLARPPATPVTDLSPVAPVLDLMVTALRTATLVAAAGRQAAEQSLRAVQREILRRISTAVLEDPSLDRTLAAITEQLQQGAGYERVHVSLEPGEAPEPERPGRATFPLVAQGRKLGTLTVETEGSRELDRSERELLRMFSESVALVVRNANLHRELTEAKGFLENMIESAAEGILALDPEHRVMTWNPAAERLFGRSRSEAVGQPLAAVLAPAVLAQIEPALQTGAASRLLTVRLEGADRPTELTVTCTPLAGEKRDPGLLMVARDVTEQRRWEEQMARSEKLSALGQLAMGMAHDFTNLLQAILGHTQLITAEPSPERLGRGLQVIEQAVRDGVETVGRIKRFARREADRRPEDVDLRDVVRQAVEIVKPRWSRSDLRGTPTVVRQNLGPVPPVRARGAELREVLINLVLNAVDAMPRGGSIDLTTRTDGPWAILAVTDTGTGIPAEVRRRIFEPFFTTKDTGTGLGLSIVSGIVSSYGGVIDVESEPGAGTTFTIRLPAASPAPPPGSEDPASS